MTKSHGMAAILFSIAVSGTFLPAFAVTAPTMNPDNCAVSFSELRQVVAASNLAGEDQRDMLEHVIDGTRLCKSGDVAGATGEFNAVLALLK